MRLNNPDVKDEAINISELNVPNCNKYLSLLDSKSQVLCGVRDPISLLKHCVGRDWTKVKRKFEPHINLTYDFRFILEFLRHKKPNISFDFEELKQSSFMLHSLLTYFESIHFIDMSELSYENAYNTVSNLANKFGFSPPSQKSKELFSIQEFRGYLRYLFPLKLYASKADLKEIFSLKRTNNRHNHHIDAFNSLVFTFTRKHNSSEINIINEIHHSYLNDDMGIYLSKKHYTMLRKDKVLYRACKNYIQEFLEGIKEVVDESQRLMLKEEELLDFLARKPKLSLQLDEELFSKEVTIVQKHRPDIVEQWKYYKQFQKNITKGQKKFL